MHDTTPDVKLALLMARVDDLPSLPAVALKVLELCRAEETSLDDLSKVLTRDPALAARILRFAGSSLYAGGEEITTLRRATLVLGLKTVQLMALSFSLTSTVPMEGRSGRFDYAEYWRRSLIRAAAARSLATRVAPLGQEEAFLAGLLVEIGRIALVRGLPTEYAEVLAQAEQRGERHPSAALERDVLGFDHRDAGEALMRAWRMPAYLRQAFRSQEGPDPATEWPPFLEPLGAVLALAEAMTEFFTGAERGPALKRVHQLGHALLGLDQDQTDTYLAGMESSLHEAGALLEIKPGSDWQLAGVLDQARAELQVLALRQTRELESLRFSTNPDDRDRLAEEKPFLDPLTGLGNAEAFEHSMKNEVWARLQGLLRRSLGLCLVEVAETAEPRGEEQEREIERALAGVLRELVRRHDFVARLSPGILGILLGDATPFGIRALAGRLNQKIQALSIPLESGEKLSFQIVAGGACLATVHSERDGAGLMEVVLLLLERARARGPGTLEVLPKAVQLA